MTSRASRTASRWCRPSAEEIEAHDRGERDGILGPSRWTDLHKPTIAAVNGVAYAGGLEWVCWCHLAVADEHATFGVTCRRWNIGLADGGTQRLPRIVGWRRAMELIVTGRVIDAAEAREIGLVNEVVPGGTCLDRALELAEEIAALPQPAIRTDLEAAERGWGRPLEEGLLIEAECFNRLLGTTRSSRGCGASTSATIPTATGAGSATPGLRGAATPRARRLTAMVIAIDGPAGAGKSSVARGVADALGFTYLDSGAMYRCVALAAIERGVDLDDPEAMGGLADSLEIGLRRAPRPPRRPRRQRCDPRAARPAPRPLGSRSTRGSARRWSPASAF